MPPVAENHSLGSGGQVHPSSSTRSTTVASQHEVQAQDRAEPEEAVAPPLDCLALANLLVQHFSNSWGQRTAEFAVYLFLVTLFPDTLLPASIYGFATTGSAMVLSGWAGKLVDDHHNLRVVRASIVVVKLAACIMYAGSLVLLYHERNSIMSWNMPLSSGIFALIVAGGCVHNLAGVTISVAVERDWVTTIAGTSPTHLTTLNTYMRRIDLLCKLLAPFFVSLLTSAASYRFAAILLCGVDVVCLVFELIWTEISYRRFPALQEAQTSKEAAQRADVREERTREHSRTSLGMHLCIWTAISRRMKATLLDWHEFSREPVFLSSLAISSLYMTVLSFDGTMLSYLKAHTYSDAFLAGIRGLNVLAGLLGTLAMPLMERKLGLVRAGNWSIWSEVLCLLPVLIAFFVGAPSDGSQGPAWNATLLFGGMMLSRIGLWAFDLCQLKELQLALATHPRRNSLTALQYSLQNVADMLRYTLTIILSRPSQFKYAALASFISVCTGALTYLVYVKNQRGHLLHHSLEDLIPLLKRRPRRAG
ncbi:Ferroporti-1 [Trametes gibbosa]|nr:Ferroporti-1 [Trametes gibbosa]